MRPSRVPRAGWLAVGSAAGAGAVALGAPAAAAVLGGAAALLLALVARSLGTVVGVRPLAAAGVGVMLIGTRIALGPISAGPPDLEAAGRPPWTAEVLAVGSPKDGSQIARLAIRTDGEPVVVAATLPAFPVVTAGSTVTVDGRLQPPPGDDPYGAYLHKTGASGSLRATGVQLVSPPPSPSLQGMRDGAGDALRLALAEPEAGLAAGILIGLRERVDRDLAAAFATAGVSHVVAISGWNIALVAALVGTVLRRRSRRLIAVGTAGVVAAYVLASGASPSVVRAAVMAGVVLAARGSGRSVRAPAALSLAVVGMLLVEPALIADAGFRLSVLATAGLLAWATPLGAWLGRAWGGRLPGPVAEGLGITLAAQAATLPDVLATFGRLSLVSPVTNLLVVPLVPAAMATGAVALVGGWAVMLGAPAILGTLAGLPGWLVLRAIVTLVRITAALPFAAVQLPEGSEVPVALASAGVMAGGLLTIAWAAGRRRDNRHQAPARPAADPARRRPRLPHPAARGERLALAGAALAVALSAIACADALGRADRLVVLDVGQGDAILIESADGARALVDGGPDPSRVLTELDAVVPPWDRRIDALILTHPHEDHVAGLVAVLGRYRVGRVFEPGMAGSGPGWSAWVAALRRGPARERLAAGDRMAVGDVALEVLWPRGGTVPTTPAATGRGFNDVSIVLLGTAGGHRFLLTGDAEEDVDPPLIAGGLPRVDVLKVAHHGSATASSAALLDVARPAIALISVGAGNDYGHPARSTLARLADVGARVYRTDRDGRLEVRLTSDGVDVATDGARTAAAITRLGYDRPHDRTGAPRGRPPAPLARSARVVPAARLRRGRRGGMARHPPGSPRRGDRDWARRGGGIAPRRGQAPCRRRGSLAPPCRGVRSLARRPRDGRARSAGAGPPGDASRRGPPGRALGRSARRRPRGGVRGQARRAAPGVDGRAIRLLAATVPVRSRRPRPDARRRADRHRVGR